jgi:hypothetical protein
LGGGIVGGLGGSFMAITASQAYHTAIFSSQFRLGLKWWLGLPIVSDGTSCPECQAAVDVFGDPRTTDGLRNAGAVESAVPEVDPAAFGGGLSLLLGVLACLENRRRLRR